MSASEAQRRAHESSSTSTSERMSNAVSVLAAVAITILLFVILTGVNVLWPRLQSRRRQGAPPLKELQRNLTDRLLLSGALALIILILQQGLLLLKSSDIEDDTSHGDEFHQSSYFWTLFLYVNGVLVAFLLIAVNHLVYWSFWKSHMEGPPCDETVNMGDSDDDASSIDDEEIQDDTNDDEEQEHSLTIVSGSADNGRETAEVPITSSLDATVETSLPDTVEEAILPHGEAMDES